MRKNNVRTMRYLSNKIWSRPVHKQQENGKPSLCSSNQFEGESDSQIKPEVYYVKFPEVSETEKLNYMLLCKLSLGCECYLGCGNRNMKYLWAQDAQEQITKMKELWSSFAADKKPKWLTMEQIKEYEKQMIER